MDDKLQAQLKELFDGLPKPIQNAITSADVRKKMRELSDTQKLHLDQWESLENEVLMALFGLKPIEDIEKNIKQEVKVSDETAAFLASEISAIVFAPIREELERELEHPDAKAVVMNDVEAARTQILGEKGAGAAPTAPAPSVAVAPSVVPATPPPPPPTEKAIRMPASGAYKPGEPSAARKDIHDDPYREPPQ